MAIEKRGKSYYVRALVNKDETGKQNFLRGTVYSRADAKMLENELEQQALSLRKHHQATTADKMDIGQYFDEWISLHGPHLSPTTVHSYKDYRAHYVGFFKTTKIRDIDEHMVRRYLAEKVNNDHEGHRIKGKVSVTTLRKHFYVLQEMLNDVLKDKNPLRYITAPSPTKYKPILPTGEQIDQLRAAFKGTDSEVILMLAAWCGLRLGEIFGLYWADIDFKAGVISIKRDYVAVGKEYIEKIPKSDKGLRTLVVEKPVLNLLRQKQLREKVTSLSRIFDVRPSSWQSHFCWIAHHKLKMRFRFHDLRHYHASELYEHDVPDHYAADRLGHDIIVLKGVYQHLGLQKRKDTDDKIRSLHKKK